MKKTNQIMSQLRQKDLTSLQTDLNQAKVKLSKIKISTDLQKEKDVSQLKKTRIEIARLKTVINERA